jgi:hypothetical protein
MASTPQAISKNQIDFQKCTSMRVRYTILAFTLRIVCVSHHKKPMD